MFVRRALATAGIGGLLVVLAAGPALAADPTAPPAPLPPAVGEPVLPAPPAGAPTPPEAPPPPPGTTTDCGLPPNDQPTGEPPGATPTVGVATATPGLDPGVICIASGVAPGGVPPRPAPRRPAGDTAGGGAPQLPRTGPAPVLPTASVGLLLVLLGGTALVAGRRSPVR